MNRLAYLNLVVAGLLTIWSSQSQAANINAGKERAIACQGCHGEAGVSSNPAWPNLAGQSANYLEAQLTKFKSGLRDNATMKPIAQGLSETDMQNLAAYYASLSAKSAGGDPVLAKTGKDKAAMCLGCHGNNAQGNGLAPKLAGQQAVYLAKQLHDFKSGARKAPQMNAVSQTLSDDDIKALAAYLATL